ncbi:MAG: hypothetical protein EBX39_05050 [Actinobacteria bacterium]|nr:hypothetical protein [Actinomycetota bacterium]
MSGRHRRGRLIRGLRSRRARPAVGSRALRCPRGGCRSLRSARRPSSRRRRQAHPRARQGTRGGGPARHPTHRRRCLRPRRPVLHLGGTDLRRGGGSLAGGRGGRAVVRHPTGARATGMTAIAKHLAAGLEVRTATRVAAIEVMAADPIDGWRIRLEDGGVIEAGAVVLTAPVPQTLELFDAGGVRLDPADRRELEAIAYHPCIAVLALLDGPSGLPEPGALRPAAEPLDWVADNQRKGISAVPALTVHAGPVTSAHLWDAPDDEVVTALLDAVPGLSASPVAGGVQVQRWRYARPATPQVGLARKLLGLPPVVLAGDAFAGSRVPGAAASGWAAAEELLTEL